MENITCLIFMIFLHIVDDYYLQGILASMKQRGWWKERAPENKYRYDYLAALVCHGFSWSFMIMLPLLFVGKFSIILFICNIILHCFIDNLKANKKKINLIQDQSMHLVQIILTWVLCVFVGGIV